MVLKNINHKYSYDMQKLCTVFFPLEKITDGGQSDIEVITELSGESLSVTVRLYDKVKHATCKAENGDENKTALSVLLFKTLCDVTGFTPPWGILFGVRPVKLMRRITREFSEKQAKEQFIGKYLVTPEKTELTYDVMKKESGIIALSKPESFSLYVSIPFCPTRCAYCSFVSHSVENARKLIEPYVELLCREIEKTAEVARSLSLRLETVYFGGGTPTSFTANQLSRIFGVIERSFDLSTLREYTVEAGRPDTITAEKLFALKEAGVGRISINPQSFNDKVLEAIGRKHTCAQTIEAYNLAAKCGFKNINTDVIAGLPCDTEQSFENTIDTCISLDAGGITVHSLALKTAANMAADKGRYDSLQNQTAADMVDYSCAALSKNGYAPYYMYRQSKSRGNLENVGWCRDGYDCLYNVFMMEETHTVLAVGAGGVTRLKAPFGEKIERIYNFKYPYEYIDRFDEMLARKGEIIDFYEKYTKI